MFFVGFVFFSFLDSKKPLSEFKLSSLKTSYKLSWYLFLLTWFLRLLCGLDEGMAFSSRRSGKRWADWVKSIALFVGHGSVKPERAPSLPARILQK